MDNKSCDKHKKSDCHKKAAEYYKQAAHEHLEAAKYCEADDCGKAAIASQKAFGFACAAKKHVKRIAMHCAGIDCSCHCCEKK